MEEFKRYLQKQIVEIRPYVAGETLLFWVSISRVDRQAGSPKVGDMIARNSKNHNDQWLVAKARFEETYEPIKQEK